MSLAVARRRAVAPHHALAALPQLVLTEVAADTFTRANGALAGSNGWAASDDGTMAIASDEAIGTAAAIKGNFRTDAYDSDQYSQAAIGSLTNINNDFQGLTVRNNASTGACYAALYFVDSAGHHHLQLYKRTAGPSGFSLIANPLQTSEVTCATGDVLRLVAEGGQVTLYKNDAPIVTALDPSPLTGGTPGIISFGAVTLDSWAGGNAHTGAVAAATATDAFTRADGGLSSGQANWAAMTGYPAVDIPIVSDALAVTTGSHAADVRTDAFNADQWSAIKMGATFINATGFVGVLARVSTDQTSGYLAMVFGPNLPAPPAPFADKGYTLYRLDNSVSTLIGWCYRDSANPADAAGTEYKIVAKGSRISFRVNDAEVIAVTDATYAAGKPGVMLFPSATADSWSGGNV